MIVWLAFCLAPLLGQTSKPLSVPRMSRRLPARTPGPEKLKKVGENFALRGIRRRSLGLGLGLLGLGELNTAVAKPRPPHPSRDEVESLFNPTYIWDESLPFVSEDMDRLNQNPDSLFYDTPKFVEHIDDVAVKALTSFQRDRLEKIAEKLGKKSENLRILDACSSWVSHIGEWRCESPGEVIGLGMNAEELKANPILTARIVKDLNQDVSLPYKDSSFDVVLCQLSIDYLTKPVEFMHEAFRILRPEGEVIITFSNRLFFEKAVAVWTGKSDLDHMETVGQYMHYSGANLRSIHAFDLLPSAAKSGGDPLYAVIGIKGK